MRIRPQQNPLSPAPGGEALPRAGASALAARERLSDYFELTKPRLSLLSVITAMVGYFAADPVRDTATLLALLVGTSLAAGGAAALNQWLEREADARMARTRERPVAAGRVAAHHAFLFGLALAIGGCVLLAAGTQPLAAALAAATIASYVLLYTPLKQLTALNTLVGAVPGALPPLIGWAAAQGGLSTLGWMLFGLLFLWQLPHFYAIAWTYREDYARGGFVMVGNGDATGARVARHAFAFTLVLLPASLLPTLSGHTGWLYGAVALAGGLLFLRAAAAFVRAEKRDPAARRLFLASIAYLPAVLVALVLDLWLLG